MDNFLTIGQALIRKDLITSVNISLFPYPKYIVPNTAKQETERLSQQIVSYESKIRKAEEKVKETQKRQKSFFFDPQKEIAKIKNEIWDLKAEIERNKAQIDKLKNAPPPEQRYVGTDTAYLTSVPNMTKSFTSASCQLLQITYQDGDGSRTIAVTNDTELILQLQNATAAYEAYKERYHQLKSEGGGFIQWVSDSYEDKAIDFYLHMPDFQYVFSEKPIDIIVSEISKL